MLPIAIGLGMFLPAGIHMLVAITLAAVWCASPWAQYARNQCHMTNRLGAFGLDAVMGATRLGLRTGLNCVLACWPIMLLPLLVDTGHLAAMLGAGVYVFADRVAAASLVQWRIPPAVETAFGGSMIRLERRLTR